MALRTRIAITASIAVALALLVISIAVYVSTARSLNAELDRGLRNFAQGIGSGPSRGGPRVGDLPGAFGGPGGFVQAVTGGGQVVGPPGSDTQLPVDDATLAVAQGSAEPYFSTVEVRGRQGEADAIPVRVYTTQVRARGESLALQVARPLQATRQTLQSLRRRLVLLGLVGAGLLGFVVARRAVRPVRALTGLAEDVATTGDLRQRIDTSDLAHDDELGRLARTFNTMLERLQQSRTAQVQLVADASHELRTPLTSLRTNIEVLAADDGPTRHLSTVDRQGLLTDLVVQLEEFGRLVDALVELARAGQPLNQAVIVQLDDVVDAAVDRAGARSGRRDRIIVHSDAVEVTGDAHDLDRAIANLLDNALKYGADTDIQVRVGRDDPWAVVEVRDHGPGIAPDDLQKVFDRFYRAPAARAAPGSGLGLAIVDQIANRHGGLVRATNAPEGGAVMTLQLPLATHTGPGV